MNEYHILPSLLSADFAKLGEESEKVLKAGGNALHFDVMDNHYVPNLTVGPLVCRALRQYGIRDSIDVHLMTRPVDSLIIEFAKAGASSICIHPEASDHIDRSLQLIRSNGCKVGLALNPATPLSTLDHLTHHLDYLLIMSVNPGFGGQSFIPSSLEKIRRARTLINMTNKSIRLAVDGGVRVDNIADIAQAGADTFIAGSAIFSEANYETVIQQMRAALKKVNHE